MKILLGMAVLGVCALAASIEKKNVTSGGELRFAVYAEPKSWDPWLMDDVPSEAVRYLTEGALVRVNRRTQQLEPELAASWKIAKDGRRIEFELRHGVKFPDGGAFTSRDVVATFRKLLDPALHSPVADAFKFERGAMTMSAAGDYTVIAEFPSPTPGAERFFDPVAIVNASATSRPVPGLGPFLLAERRSGSSILLKRNPAYWKRDASGKQLPYLDSIRIEVQQNRDLELLKFRRGELQLIDALTPDLFDRLSKEMPDAVSDNGPTTDSEFLWFNQVAPSRLPEFKPEYKPEYKKDWFRSVAFRRAVSEAINRADLSRLAYKGHASPAAGPVSPTNKLWFNAAIQPESFNPAAAMKLLASEGFRQQNGSLVDARSNPVEFSIITNAGSKTRETMAALIQQDLSKLGMKVNVVTLDFPSLIERITRNFDYEACLLGFVNVDPDPNGVMNVFLSSAANHAWNPAQKSPATPWEAEMDRMMLAQSSTADYRARKKAFDRVQEIVHDQAPIIYLVHPNALSAALPELAGVAPAAFYPHVFWNAERLSLAAKARKASAEK